MKKNQLTETNSEMTQMTKITDKSTNKWEHYNWNSHHCVSSVQKLTGKIEHGNTEAVRRTHVKLLEMKTTMYEIKKITLDGTDSILDTAENKICEPE